MKPEFYRNISVRGVEFPLFVVRVAAGFPSPADDYIENTLDLNDFLIEHPAATFFVRVTGDSMIGAGINSGDYIDSGQGTLRQEREHYCGRRQW
jgi:DNA polymerase V